MDADELQELELALHRARQLSRQAQDEEAYLHRAMENAKKNLTRKAVRERKKAKQTVSLESLRNEPEFLDMMTQEIELADEVARVERLLSERAIAILRMCASGHYQSDIAKSLQLSTGGIKHHMRAIRDALSRSGLTH